MPEPTLPTADDIAKLPRWARVAFAARCARRAFPFFAKHWPAVPAGHLKAVEAAIDVAEHAADADAARDAAHAAFAAARAAADAADAHAAHAADAAAHAADATYAARKQSLADARTPLRFDSASHVAYATARAHAAARAAAEADARKQSVGAIVADFELLSLLAAKGRWTDDTPVPPTVFERAVLHKQSWRDDGEKTPVYEDALKTLLVLEGRLPEVEAAMTPRTSGGAKGRRLDDA